jgi:DNA repair protein RadC
MQISEALPRPNRSRRLGALRLVKVYGLVRTHAVADDRIAIRSPRDVYEFMAPYAAREESEVFWILALDAIHQVLFNSPIVISTGILNSSLVHPREVFRAAIVAGAAAVILVHNHPSGDPAPSADDRAVTEQLVAAGRLLDIPVHDHVVVGRGRYASFAETGLI